MENKLQDVVENTESTKFGIQGTLVLHLGSAIEEHKLIPEMLTEDEFEEVVEKYTKYGEYSAMELECLDSYGNVYTLILNKHMLTNTYFKFQRVNVQQMN